VFLVKIFGKERQNDNIIVSGPLKIGPFGPIFTKNNVFLLKLKLIEISKIFFHENYLMYVVLNGKHDKKKNFFVFVGYFFSLFSYFWQNSYSSVSKKKIGPVRISKS
jgi:hypothetical protein